MASINELNERAYQIKMRAIRRLVNSLLADFRSLEPEIIRQLQQFGFVDGRIKANIPRQQVVREILNILDSTITGPAVTSAANGMFASIEEIDNINAQIHAQLNDINDISGVVGANRSQIIADITTQLFGDEYRKNFIIPVQKGLTQRIMTGIGFNQLEAYLAKHVGDTPWVRFVAFNAVQQYDGAINEAIANEFGLNAYRYVGSLIDDSRPQCIRWVGKEIIERKDLAKELEWARANGSGIIPGTNTKNFARFRGGYNCRHQAYPIRLKE